MPAKGDGRKQLQGLKGQDNKMRRKGAALIVSAIMLGICMIACGEQNEQQADTNPDASVTNAPVNQDANPTVAPQAGEIIYVTATPTPFVTPTPATHAKQPVSFSIENNFVAETTALELSAEGAEAIYYTTDGKIPDETAQIYHSPITLRAGKSITTYSISARALYADGTWSDTSARTYFAGQEVAERYDTLIFSITTDPYNLYDYEYGILVTGKIMDDYLLENPGAEIDGHTPANYGMRGKESERPIYVEVLNSDGSLILEQDAGVRVYGGWSRSNDMKSLKLFARKEYDEENNKFRYPFFTTAQDENGEVIDSFKRLVLRAYGNDINSAFIREELFQTLAKQAGYEAKAVRPVAVYVNGEYFGAYYLTEPYHESYFEEHYGKFDGVMEILEGGELFKEGESDGSNQYAVDDYVNMYDKYAYADLTDDATYAELCALMDVQNYIEYYAYEFYVGNEDWPENNYKAYRYYAAEGEEYSDEAPFDGKWRFLLHDMDFSTGIYGTGVTECYLPEFVGKLGNIGEECPLFCQLMCRKDCQDIFIKKTLELLNGVFREDYLAEQLDIMHQERLNEQNHSMESGKIATWSDISHTERNMSSLESYMVKRGNYVYMNLYAFFGLDCKKYSMDLRVPENCNVTINDGFTTDRSYEALFYSCYDNTFTADSTDGKQFAYWLVDGVKYTEKKLTVTEAMLNGTTIIVEAVFQ